MLEKLLRKCRVGFGSETRMKKSNHMFPVEASCVVSGHCSAIPYFQRNLAAYHRAVQRFSIGGLSKAFRSRDSRLPGSMDILIMMYFVCLMQTLQWFDWKAKSAWVVSIVELKAEISLSVIEHMSVRSQYAIS